MLVQNDLMLLWKVVNEKNDVGGDVNFSTPGVNTTLFPWLVLLSLLSLFKYSSVQATQTSFCSLLLHLAHSTFDESTANAFTKNQSFSAARKFSRLSKTQTNLWQSIELHRKSFIENINQMTGMRVHVLENSMLKTWSSLCYGLGKWSGKYGISRSKYLERFCLLDLSIEK